MKLIPTPSFLLLPSIALVLTACGGGGDEGTESSSAANETTTASAQAVSSSKTPAKKPTPAVVTPAAAPATKTAVASAATSGSSPTDSARIAAATATAQSAANLCAPIRPFYWEIGSGTGKVASGSIASTSVPTKYTANSPVSLASASKWIYGAYVAQRTNGVLSAQDVKFLTFRSGYTSFDECQQNQTVDQCLATGTNGSLIPTTEGVFYYSGGHMEKHASLMGLGGMNNAQLATEIMGQLGSDVKISYSQPMLAGGIFGTADAYAVFLRKMLNKQLKMSSLLDADSTCTNRKTCPAGEASRAPISTSESWHYSIGHWIEDDPVVGDGAFSSPGAYGFYPWINASRTAYGIVSRNSPRGGTASMQCGRLIRKAWETGTAM